MLKILEIKTKLFFRDHLSIFFTLIFCPIMLLLLGLTMGNDPNTLFDGLGNVDVSIPAYTVIIFSGVALLSFPIACVGSRERGELNRQKMMAMSPMILLLLDILVYFLLSLVGVGITVIIGHLVYGTPWADNIWVLILGMVLSYVSIFSVGILLALICKTQKTVQTVGLTLFLTMLFTSGASTPLEMMNPTMLKISNFMPIKYSVVLMRKIWMGSSLAEVKNEIGVLILILILCVILSLLIIHYDEYLESRKKAIINYWKSKDWIRKWESIKNKGI